RPAPPASSLFPYPTLFRSTPAHRVVRHVDVVEDQLAERRCAEAHLLDLARGLESRRIPLDEKRGDAAVERLRRISYRVNEHDVRSEEHTSELQSRENLVCR